MFVLIFFNDSVKHIYFFRFVLKSLICRWCCWLFGRNLSYFWSIKKKKNRKKREFRKSRIFGGSDATNWLITLIIQLLYFHILPNFCQLTCMLCILCKLIFNLPFRDKKSDKDERRYVAICFLVHMWKVNKLISNIVCVPL